MNKKRLIVDLAMVVLLPMLMAYSLVGEIFHEIAGVVIFVLFVCHNWLNIGFWKTIFKGSYSFRRIFQTLINVALLIYMFVEPITGVMISEFLSPVLPELGAATIARELHLVLAYWGFILLSMHGGAHIEQVVQRGKGRAGPKGLITVGILTVAISSYGVYAFIKRQFWPYMTLQTKFVFFDLEEPLIYFFADYMAIMVLFAFTGYLIMKRRVK